MAAAEANPRKHLENHFTAQDDGYRDSKLSTPSFSLNSERNAASDHRAHGYNSPSKPAHIPTSYQLKSDKQPDFQHQKGFAVGWAKTLHAGVDNSSVRIVSKATVSVERHQNIEELEHRVCKSYVTTEAVSNNESVNTTKKTDCIDEFHYIEDHFDNQISEQGDKVSLDLESHWIGIEKTKPWWRSASKDELASLVARKSLENVQNCDLPQPRTKHQSKNELTCFECFDQDCFLNSPFTEMQLSSLNGYNRDIHPSGGMGVGSIGHSLRHQDHFSISRTDNEENNSSIISNLNSSKAQLLEALCHSQTRAREAEKAAQEADTEKKHIVSLFLRQATQLFAYKQWFQLLQLQNICLQLRNKDQPITGLFSDALPWDPCKGNQFNKPRNRRKKRDRDHRKFTMYDIAFAVGLSLAGASLLLGWTTGWLVPPMF